MRLLITQPHSSVGVLRVKKVMGVFCAKANVNPSWYSRPVQKLSAAGWRV